jgi:hypothetical protein
MELITDDIRSVLLKNGAARARGEQLDPFPVVKLFTPDADAVWLLTELDPNDPDLAFGLCNFGSVPPQLSYMRLSVLERVCGPRGAPVERDPNFTAQQPLSAYADQAGVKGRPS